MTKEELEAALAEKDKALTEARELINLIGWHVEGPADPILKEKRDWLAKYGAKK